MISFRNFALRRGERLLLSDVDLTLQAGWRAGRGRPQRHRQVLACSRPLMGELEPDKGDLDLPGKARIASVAQETPSLPDAAIDFVLSGDVEVHAAIQAEANAFANEDWDAVAEAHHRLDELNGYDADRARRPPAARPGFPGGNASQAGVGFLRRLARAPERRARADDAVGPAAARRADQPPRSRRRAVAGAVAAALSRHAAGDLARSRVPRRRHHAHAAPARRQGQALHRRLHRFERQRAEQLRLQQIAFEKEQAERAHLQSFIDRFKAKASKAKQAQSRMKRLAKLAGTEAVRAER